MDESEIRSSDRLGDAVVEDYYVKNVNNKILNVLVLTSITGVFKYNQRVICDDLYVNQYGNTISAYEYEQLSSTDQSQYSLALTVSNGPFILGSLSGIGITNGGAGFSIGDFLLLNAEGSSGVARVSGVKDENGKVNFTLVKGGSGFSVNATVSVTGGYGAGATFKVGGLVDKEVFVINTDKVITSNSTQLDSVADGANVYITGVAGTFNIGDNVYSEHGVDVRTLDISYVGPNHLANGEALYSSAKNINMSGASPGTNLTAYKVDGSLVYIVGSQITNANLTFGTTLTSNTSGTIVSINSVGPVQNAYGNCTITLPLSGVLEVNSTSYGNSFNFVPGYKIRSATANATVTSVVRKTDWAQFPKPTLSKKNLDTQIGLILNTYDLEVGTIAYLSQINPGDGYSEDPTVDVMQADVYDLQIPDKGGYKGHNAVITAKAGNANGIVTAVEIENAGFGYTPVSQANLYSSNAQNQNIVSGRIVIDTQGVGSGTFSNRSGFLSDTQHVIDSHYWQTQSYDIIAPRMMRTYENFVRDLVHPSGIALFGSFRLLSETDNETGEPASFYTTQKKSGLVNITTGSNTVTSVSGTNFNSEYMVGNFIKVGDFSTSDQTRQITHVNSTVIEVSSNFSATYSSNVHYLVIS